MKRGMSAGGMLSLLLLSLAGFASAAPINLTGQNYVQYGDAQSYSLPTSALTSCTNSPPDPCQFNVDSSSGQIKDLVVIATGTESVPAQTNLSGMDFAYSTPSGESGSTYFNTSSATNRGFDGAINNNGDDTWDASLASLKTFLVDSQMVFFFNNNQTNQQNGATQSLAGWAQVWITNAAGGIVGIWDFTNDQGRYALFTEGGGGSFNGDVTTYSSIGAGPLAGDNTSTDFVLSGGGICYNGGVPVSCSNTHDQGPVNHNLGADDAAYAILFPEMNAILDTLFGTLTPAQLALYTFHADVRLGCAPGTAAGNCTGSIDPLVPHGRDLNNGYEQLFIGLAAKTPDRDLPEPGTLALMGLALAALAAIRSRRARQV